MYEFEDFIETTLKARTTDAIWRDLLNCTRKDGFENLVFVQMMANGHIEVPWRHLPPGYDEAYVHNKWHQIDPVLQHTLSASLPFRWHDVARRPGLRRVQLAFLNECRELGVHSGFTVPIHTPGRRDIISLSVRDQVDTNATRHPLLHAMVTQAWARHCELTQRNDNQMSFVTLSDRERSCLRWIKGGKTYDDIAHILKMSPKTVEHHLRNARQKLAVTSTIAAVVKAIQLGLLEL
jgi:DNA-binding CsgD family transcriptional regulator